MENFKRKRDRCFEYAEKSLLIDFVTDHFSVIECKKIDMASVILKNAEWQKIAEKFTAVSSTYPRDSHSLKMLWENLKRKAKAAMAIQADNNYGTGGGKAKKTVADPIVDIVVGFIQPHVEPFNNIYDDNEDVTPNKICRDFYDNIVEEEDVTEEIVVNDFVEHEIINNDWSQYNTTILKCPVFATLRQSPLPTFQTSTSTSNYLADTKELGDMKSTASATTKNCKSVPRISGDKKDVSRRRPVLKTSASETLLEAKIASLNAARMDAKEEHNIQMKILEERLQQEKMKTELLKIQIQRESKKKWVFDGNDEADETE